MRFTFSGGKFPMSSHSSQSAQSKSRGSIRKFTGYALACLVALAAGSAIFVAAPRAAHLTSAPQAMQQKNAPFTVSFGSDLSSTPLDGRVFVVISTTNEPEPRMQIVEEEARSQQLFGADIDGLAPGQQAAIPGEAEGYPLHHFSDLPAGDYWIQGVLNKYTTFKRSDGHTIKMPMDEGEGQHWNTKPGNFYSKKQKIHFDPHSGATIEIKLTETVKPIEPPKDTEWVKHVRIKSEVLSKFWGHDMYLGAIVVVPEGWATHPDARYPLLVNHGHFQRDYVFRTQNPVGQKFFQDWTTGKLPRMLLLIIQHANPYYDDSYAVDSENVGPYGEAINKELIPYIEKQFHGIGQGWARAIFGGSTGGWETLATQIFYPDDYNGAWGACPDPVDFHGYQSVNIYDDKNAYWTIGPFAKVNQPEMRAANGIIEATTEGSNRWELVLATHGRSGEQWGIWQAVFSPVGKDGYPVEIWNPLTGVINKDVVPYWRDHYDLTYIMQRDWKTLGPKLVGKLHVMVGTADTYYLDHAVHLMQKSMEASKDPHYVADFDYGVDQPHCYTGPPGSTTREGGQTFTQRVLVAAQEQMLKTAPAGADTKSWRY
jgi:hypothetical protein